ncbi:MAG: FRG domain-containing protein [Elusimicrobia bacterium]|nr:FRG domain-containing protein [Candidatus Liberimonas magnetica]
MCDKREFINNLNETGKSVGSVIREKLPKILKFIQKLSEYNKNNCYEEITLNTWEDVENKIIEIKSDHNQNHGVIFRGQSDSRWNLESSLERFGIKNCSINKYSEFINSFYEKIYKEPLCVQCPKKLDFIDHQKLIEAGDIPLNDYMVYLRHYGFPSPLLDWSEDKDVAAFFAFATPEREGVKYSSIFVYYHFSAQLVGDSQPDFVLKSSKNRLIERDKIQKTCFTVAYKNNRNLKTAEYVPFMDILNKETESQDHGSYKIMNKPKIVKIKIPRTEKYKILTIVNKRNINYYSLFKSEEAFLMNMWYKNRQSDSIL